MDHQDVLEGYAAEAGELIPRFEAIRSSEVYACVAHLLPVAEARIMDVGAGTGRDAAWLALAGRGLGSAGLGRQFVRLDQGDSSAEFLLELRGEGGEALSEQAHEG